MKLKNILTVVKDVGKSKQFYHDLFDLEILKNNCCELYFEEQDIEAFIEKLEK